MENLRFCREHLNPRLVQGELGDVFQAFVHELLISDYPDLHFFPGGGKDGAIDLTETMLASRTVVQCKFVGKDGLSEAQSRWRSDAKKLTTHLADASGPTKSQSQYRPWYITDPVIHEYLLCVSSTLKNPEQTDELRKEIAAFFNKLGNDYRHLAHLSKLSVRVLDWNDLWSRLKERPHLIFRWFPPTRPQGFVPLEETPDLASFRAYLDSSKLPYYSRAEHLKTHPPPPGTEIIDEQNLLALLEKGDITGLMVTGRGGIGKTRLTLEIGRVAQQKGWIVLRVLSRLKSGALELLAEQITPTASVLLVIDYIETQKDFNELVETINDLNDTYFLRIRYIANCRRSYYANVAATSRHRMVDLSPHLNSPVKTWAEVYREQTTRHILEHCGIDRPESYLSLCRDNPILAVFVSYLYSLGREGDLGELLHEEDFGAWVAKRVQLSFPGIHIDRELAILMALLPLPTSNLHLFEEETYRILLDGLATDGWVEKHAETELQETEGWVSLHDVLSDQIVLSHAKSVPVTLELFVQELLNKARASDCLRSAVISLQRLVDQPEFRSLDWLKILQEDISQDQAAWYEVRDTLVWTTLLTPVESIELLTGNQDIWYGAEKEWNFQNKLGWLVRWTTEQGGSAVDEGLRSVLRSWVEKAARYPTGSNFVLTWGLRVWPEALRDPALQWIVTRPTMFQTHFLLVSWLESGQPKEEISSAIRQWLLKFTLVLNANFVIRSWLVAGGDKDLIKEPMEQWLTEHGKTLQAQYVYHSWLNAGGKKELVEESFKEWLTEHRKTLDASFIYPCWLDNKGKKDLVEESIKEWLKENRTVLDAQFIYRSWLDAGGDKNLIRESLILWIDRFGTNTDADFVYRSWLESNGEFSAVKTGAIAWLSINCDKEQAGYLIKALAREPEIPINSVRNILTWCRTFPRNQDALWRITQLGRHLLRDEVAEDVYLTSESILHLMLGNGVAITDVERGQIQTLFSYLIDAPELREGELRQQIDGLFIEWLRHYASFGPDPKAHLNIQKPIYVQRVVDLVISGALDVTADREPLERFLRWVDTWDPEWKSQVYRTFDFLRHRYSALPLWNIVQIDQISDERQEAVEWYRRSVEFYQAAQYEEGIKAARKATDIDPTFTSALRSLATNLEQSGRMKEAVEI